MSANTRTPRGPFETVLLGQHLRDGPNVDRFTETSIGIGVALILTMLWPDKATATLQPWGNSLSNIQNETRVGLGR